MGILQDKDTVSNYLTESTKEFIHNWLQRLQLLLTMSDNKNSIREIIYNQTLDDLRHRKYLIRTVQNDITSLIHSFSQGVISHDTFFTDLNQSYINHFLPKSAMKSILRDYSSLYSYPVSGTLIYCTEEVNNLCSNVYAVVDHLIEWADTANRNPENGSVYQVSIDIINTYINATLKSRACRDILDRMIFRYPILLLEVNQEFSHRKYEDFKSVFSIHINPCTI